ncbi:hypothetical protein ACTHGU_09875 [Chitinophagaceae bacterium MMS25-I14]
MFAGMLFASTVSAQRDAVPKKSLHVPAVVKGFIGGESHDSYVLKAAAGKTVTISIAYKKQDEQNHAEFTVSKSKDFFSADPYGHASADGLSWKGKIPKAGRLYIYVTAYPEAHYTLKVK